MTKVFVMILLLFAGWSFSSLAQSRDIDDILLLKLIPRSWVTHFFSAPKTEDLPQNRLSEEIRYGEELINRTAYYIGPNGKVGTYLGNRMNCRNCHLDGGRRLFGGSFATTHTRYPEYRAREDIIISLADRINYCIVRPHNGKPLPHDSREMRAMLIYLKWLSEDRPANSRRFGDRLMELRLLDRAADPKQGEKVYRKHCQVCHGENGEGLLDEQNVTFIYPPLWGPESYGIGSSMHRIRPAAAFIKANMPYGTTWEKPVLSDEEAYDVAAFINDDRIHSRPQFDVTKDYPDLLEKPIDYPYGPYLDSFTEHQHRFGPFKPIIEARKKIRKERSRLKNSDSTSDRQ